MNGKTAALMAATALGLTAGEAAAADAPASIGEAIAGGKLILEGRARYEGVDQANLAKDASALTLRTRLGWETGAWNGLKALVEFEDVRAVGGRRYNSTLNGRTAYPVVADPEVTELNRAQIAWTPNKAFTATLGRQRIVLDDQRFVGAVGWRQDEQTFDAVRADATFGKLKVTGAWIDQVNRVFGEGADFQSDSWLVNASYAGPAAFKPSVFYYALDFANSPPNASKTWGVRVTGSGKAGAVGWAYAASYARQTDHASNPADFGLDYAMVEGAASVGIATLKAGYESLEGDGAKGFATPLATLHAFQGWADVFLVTPANGIEDVSLSLILKPRFDAVPGLQLMIVGHDFTAQRGGADLGEELDLQVTAPLGKRLTATLKYADYDGVAAIASRQKVWVGFDFKL